MFCRWLQILYEPIWRSSMILTTSTGTVVLVLVLGTEVLVLETWVLVLVLETQVLVLVLVLEWLSTGYNSDLHTFILASPSRLPPPFCTNSAVITASVQSDLARGRIDTLTERTDCRVVAVRKRLVRSLSHEDPLFLVCVVMAFDNLVVMGTQLLVHLTIQTLPHKQPGNHRYQTPFLALPPGGSHWIFVVV